MDDAAATGGGLATGGAVSAGGTSFGPKATGGDVAARGGASTGGSRALDCRAADTANELTPKDGWVAGGANCAGIQGLYWTAHDEVSTIEPTESADINFPICVEATLVKVPGNEFDTYWGTTLGLNLSQASPSELRGIYDATDHGVSGFRFAISGANPPPPGRLRFNIIAADESIYCILVEVSGETTGTFEISFDELRKSCWDPDSDERLDPSAIRVVQFNLVPTGTDAPSYSFCLDSLSAVRSIAE